MFSYGNVLKTATAKVWGIAFTRPTKMCGGKKTKTKTMVMKTLVCVLSLKIRCNLASVHFCISIHNTNIHYNQLIHEMKSCALITVMIWTFGEKK